MRGAKRKELVIKLIFKHFELGPESARGYRCTKAHNINFNATEKQQSSYIHPNSCQITCLHFNQGCGNCIGSERNIYTVDYTDCACYGNEVWNIPCLVLRFFFSFFLFHSLLLSSNLFGTLFSTYTYRYIYCNIYSIILIDILVLTNNDHVAVRGDSLKWWRLSWHLTPIPSTRRQIHRIQYDQTVCWVMLLYIKCISKYKQYWISTKLCNQKTRNGVNAFNWNYIHAQLNTA